MASARCCQFASCSLSRSVMSSSGRSTVRTTASDGVSGPDPERFRSTRSHMVPFEPESKRDLRLKPKARFS